MKVVAGGKDTVGDANRIVQSIPASYTVWKDGTQAIAECNLKGGTDYTTGTDTTVWQAALDAITGAGGGVLSVRNGSHYTGALNVHSKTHIVGEGEASQIYGSLLANGEYLFNCVGGVGTEIRDVSIENLYVNVGYSDVAAAKWVAGAFYGTHLYRNINIRNNIMWCGSTINTAALHGIRIDESNTGILLEQNIIEHFGSFGIKFVNTNCATIQGGLVGNGYASSIGIQPTGNVNTIKGVNFAGGGAATVGLRLSDGTATCSIRQCYFELQLQNAIQVGTPLGEDPIPQNNHIEDCYFDTGDAGFYHVTLIRGNNTTLRNLFFNNGTYGIYVAEHAAAPGTCEITNTFIENVYKVATTTALINQFGATIKGRGVGFEASGIGTGNGGQQTIPHGLLITPTRVQLTDLESAAVPYQSAVATDTNIYVTAANNQDYLWKAWYET